MFLDKEYFDGWMQRLSERLERIEKLCAGDVEQPLSILPDGERLLDNYDLCRMLNISKRTLQRYRTSGVAYFLRIKEKKSFCQILNIWHTRDLLLPIQRIQELT